MPDTPSELPVPQQTAGAPAPAKPRKYSLPPDFIDTARDRFQERLDAWRTAARDSYDFLAGKQWEPDDLNELEREERPALTFNYASKMVDAVIGAEVNNRQEVVFRPRGLEDTQAAEAYTEAARWARSLSNAEFEESDALRDMLTCGLGWTETGIDYSTDPDGLITIERVDPLEMDWDRASDRAGLTDRRWVCRAYWADLAAAKRAWPDFDFTMTGDSQETAEARNAGVEIVREGRAYKRNSQADADEDIDRSDMVYIRHYQCVYKERHYRVAIGPQTHEIPTADFSKELRAQLDEAGIPYAPFNKNVYYRAFFCDLELIEGGRSPCQAGFTFTPITGKRDRNAGTWYGLTRDMEDPQRWANKWLSQAVYIMNANAKGGLLAETDAFVDPRRAEEEWARPDSITLLKTGGLEKVKEKQQSPYPAGFDRLMTFALESLPMVTGINLEALGLANREQAGVLESQRKQAAYGILAPYFDAMRLYRREQGRILFYYLRTYIADGRWIRLLGNEATPAIQLNKLPDSVTFDIIVEQAPSAPDVKQRTWESLVEILPGMLKAGVPIPPDILDYTPLPSALAQKWKQYIQQRSQQPSPEQMAQMQQEMQQTVQENQQLKLQLKDKSTELQLKAQEAQAELQLKQQELAAKLRLQQAEVAGKIELQKQQFELDSALTVAKTEADTQMQRDKNEADQSLQRDKITGERKIKALQAGLTTDGDEGMGMVSDAVRSIEQGQQRIEAALTQQQQSFDQLAALLGQLLQTARAPRTATMPDGRRITIATGGQPAQPQQPTIQ